MRCDVCVHGAMRCDFQMQITQDDAMRCVFQKTRGDAMRCRLKNSKHRMVRCDGTWEISSTGRCDAMKKHPGDDIGRLIWESFMPS